MILDSSLEDDSMIASPATSMMRDDLNVSQDNNAPDNSHGDPSDQHDSAQEAGNQSLNSTGLHLHIGQHDLISDTEEPNISHSEFHVNEENVDNLRPHFNEKILNIDEFFMKRAATTFGFQEPKRGGNSYSIKGYGHTLTTYISNSTIMIQPTDILFPTMYKSNFGGVVKYLALVLEYYQDPAKAERLREEKRKDLIKKRARSNDQDDDSPVPRKKARNDSPRTSGRQSPKRNRGHNSPRKNDHYSWYNNGVIHSSSRRAATTLLHQGEGDPEEMSCGVQGLGQTLQFQGVSRDLELHQDTQSTDVTALAIMIEPRIYLIELEMFTPPRGIMRGISRMMLEQHHRRPPQDQRQIVDMRKVIPRHQPRLLMTRGLQQLKRVLQKGTKLLRQL